jgi:hypothetical protein
MISMHLCGEKSAKYLVTKRLWRVINDDSLVEITTQDMKILDIIPINANTMLTEQAMSG